MKESRSCDGHVHKFCAGAKSEWEWVSESSWQISMPIHAGNKPALVMLPYPTPLLYSILPNSTPPVPYRGRDFYPALYSYWNLAECGEGYDVVMEQFTRSHIHCGVYVFNSELGGIPILVRLLDHELEEIHRAAAASLRNLSYSKSRDENKVNRKDWHESVQLEYSWPKVLLVVVSDVSGLNPEHVTWIS